MLLGGRASTWFTNKPNNRVRPSLYPDKITSVPHSFYTNSGEKKKPKQGKQNKNKTHSSSVFMFSVIEMKFKLQQ